MVFLRGGFPEAVADLLVSGQGWNAVLGSWPVVSVRVLKIQLREVVMSIQCDVTLQGSVTPEQLSALGAALWRRCYRAAGSTHTVPLSRQPDTRRPDCRKI
jgi:hypothetical protein